MDGVSSKSSQLKQSDLIKWHTWSSEAFIKAKRENKPIFLSIGYIGCHWCRVMEIESFKDRDIAETLNKDFISIRVDRDERPDINRYFQNIYLAMNGKDGGWPLSIFMTSDKIPIFSATYIPLNSSYGIMSLKSLLKNISKKYQIDRENSIQKGREIVKSIQPKREIKATKITNDLIKIATSQIKSVYDKNGGGFGKAPKFPRISVLELSLNLYHLTGERELLDIIINSLNNMSLGGFYDLVDGGYFKYSTDDIWLVPHFEKMIYDSALLISFLTQIYEITGKSIYLKLAKDNANFLIYQMMNEDGLFFSSIDATENSFEGKYYLFGYDEVLRAFKDANIDTNIIKRLNITEKGNIRGLNIVRISDLDSLLDKKEIENALRVLKTIRAKKRFPNVNKKILTSWNAMVIKALFDLGKIEENYLKVAENSLKRLIDSMLDGDKLYRSKLKSARIKGEGFLEDYAYLALATAEAYKVTKNSYYLEHTQNLINVAIKRFYKDGKWSISDGEFKDFAEDIDISYPSEIGIVLKLLLLLKESVDNIYQKFIERSLEVHSYELMREPLSRATLTQVAIKLLI